MSRQKLYMIFRVTGLLLMFNLLFLVFGNQTVQARSCGVNTENVHDYAGLMVNMRWQKSGSSAYEEADNTKVKLNTIGDVSTPPGGLVYYKQSTGAENDRRDSAVFQQDDFPGCPYNASGDNHMVMLGYDGSSRIDESGDYRRDTWVIDCDSSVRDPDDNGSHPGWDSKYQKIRVSAVGVPKGAKSGGKWHVYGEDPDKSFIDVAPANGYTEKITFIYKEPPSTTITDPACTKYSHSLGKHSNYKFTVFPNSSGPGATTWGADNFDTTSKYYQNQGAWAAFGNGNVAVYERTNSSDSSQDFSFDFPSPSSNGWIVMIERWDHNTNHRDLPSPEWDGNEWEYTYGSSTINDCYTGDIEGGGVDCSSLHIEGGRPPGGNANSIRANSGFNLAGVVTNRGDPARVPSIPITVKVIDGGGMAGSQYVTDPLDGGYSEEFYVPMMSLDDISSRVVVVQPQYNGFAIGPNCSINVDTYKEYQVDPTASITSLDNENPSTISYSTGGSIGSPNPGIQVTIPENSEAYVASDETCNNKVAGKPSAPTSETNNYGSVTTSRTTTAFARPNTVAGDIICVKSTIPAGHGWVGPPVTGGASSNVIPINATTNYSQNRIVNKPYVRMYGQDVFAGGNFPNSTNVDGAINANYRATGIGSGVEYAAFALGDITQFASSNLRTSLFDQLNFASGSPRGRFGGNHTITDYFKYRPANATEDLTALDDTASRVVKQSGNVTLTGRTINGLKSLFVEGDVYITGNIVLAGDNSWPNANAVSSFSLIVRGNIYIDRNVARIDGLLVAQPVGSSKGEIRTCTTDSSGTPGSLTTAGDFVSEADGQCSKQLIFNGALVAQKIKWLRTHKTLSDNKAPREPYNNTSAAEIVNTAPDFYISQPSYLPSAGGTSGKYDAYQALPPIL